MNVILYGAKIAGENDVVFVSLSLSDVANFVENKMMVIIRFVVTIDNFTVV